MSKNKGNQFKITFKLEIVIYVVSFIINLVFIYYITPAEYGIYFMILPIFYFIQIFNTFWCDSSIVIKKENTQKELSSLFWIKIFNAVILCIIFYYTLKYASIFFGYNSLEKLGGYFIALIFLTSISIIYQGLLLRYKKFAFLSKCKLFCIIFSSIVGLILLIKGYGIVSILLKEITLQSLLLIFYLAKIKWTPSLVLNVHSVSFYLKKGSEMTTTAVLGFFSRNIDDILIGRRFGSTSLGLYSKAYGLLYVPTLILSKVYNTVNISHVASRSGNMDLAFRLYRKSLKGAIFIIIPFCLMIYFISDPLLKSLFPESWLEIIPLIKVFALLAMLQSIWPIENIIYHGCGKTKHFLKNAILVNFIILTGIFFGIFYFDTLYEFAIFYSFVNIPAYLMSQYFLSKLLEKRFANLLRISSPYLLIGTSTFVLTFLSLSQLNQFSSFWQILIGFLLVIIIYLGFFFFLEKDKLLYHLGTIRQILNKS